MLLSLILSYYTTWFIVFNLVIIQSRDCYVQIIRYLYPSTLNSFVSNARDEAKVQRRYRTDMVDDPVL